MKIAVVYASKTGNTRRAAELIGTALEDRGNDVSVQSVDDLDLSVRAQNCLRAASIKTIGDLVRREESEMLKFRNFGRKSLLELVQVLDERGHPAEPGVDGAIVAKLPLPPGAFPTLWNDDERYVSSYMSAFEGYYLTGDGGHLDADGYVFVMGRTDDVINVAGHRLSTGGMEEVLASHPDVAECAVIGVADTMKGQVPRGFVVLKAGVDSNAEGYEDGLRAELVQMVRDQIGAVASLKDVAIVPALPKTRSGKILRKTMRGIADGAEEPVPSTIDDASVLDTLRPVLRRE